MRLVAILVVVVILGVAAVMVFNAVGASNEDTLDLLTASTTTAPPAVLPGPGGQPIVLDTLPDAAGPAVPPVQNPARAAVCATDRKTLETAIEAYTGLEGSPPADEQALVDAGWLKEPSVAWDVRDGVLVAQDPACA